MKSISAISPVKCYYCKKIIYSNNIFCSSKCEEAYLDKWDDSVMKKINTILKKYNELEIT